MSESSSLKSGDLVAPDGLVLVSERVSVVLLEKEYRITIAYQQSSAKGLFDGVLYFPILCRNREEQTTNEPCVTDYRVTLEGKNIESGEKPAEVLGSLETAFKTRVYDPKLVNQYLDASAYEDLNTGADNLVRVFGSAVQADKKDFLLVISYRQPYYCTTSGTTKSSLHSYSDDIVYYDFSPAGSWMRGPVASVRVEVDAKAANGPVHFPAGWSFTSAKGTYVAERKNVRFTDVPPLVIAVDNRNRQQYLSHKNSAAEYARMGWQLASPDTLAHPRNAYAPDKAMDDNIGTSWCSGKDRSEIVMTIAPLSGSDRNGTCGFEGLGLINGYTRTAERFEANRRVKSGTIEIEGVMKGTFKLKDPDMSGGFDPYRALCFILPDSENSVKIAEPKDKHVRITSGKPFTVRLKILETYPGKKDTDVCITELYPMFNCY